MDRDKLRNLLGLAPETLHDATKLDRSKAASDSGREADRVSEAGLAPAIATPQALLLDKWDVAQGERLYNLSPALQRQGTTAAEAADFFGLSYLHDPQQAEACQDSRRLEFVKTLSETPEYKALHENTTYNLVASDIAACQFSEQFAGLKKEDKQREGSPKKGSPEKQQQKAEAALMRAVGKACQAAAEQVEEYQDTMSAMGCGTGQGQDSQLDPEKLRKTFEQVKNNRMLRRIIELAGRFRLAARSRQRQKAKHGMDDVVGVELGDNVARLLPQELALLTDPVLELDLLRRLTERQAMQKKFRGQEKNQAGPIVVCVDESGSMEGEPVMHAKAFALAMAWVAWHQRRWCALVGYSGGRSGTLCVLKPGQPNEAELLEWLAHFYDGGTSMDVPLDELPNRYWPQINPPRGKTDVVLITDGIVSVPPDMERNFNAWKQANGVKCISLILAASTGGLARVSDEVFLLDDLRLEQEGIQTCLSI